LFYIYNTALTVAKRATKIIENVDETVIMPREVMVISAHDNHMTPVEF
jgi:hypothetical protein